jgi:hypothetical protein
MVLFFEIILRKIVPASVAEREVGPSGHWQNQMDSIRNKLRTPSTYDFVFLNHNCISPHLNAP